MRRDRQVLVMAGVASAAALTLGTFAGTGTTYAAFSDFAVVSGQAGASVWTPDPEIPAECGDPSKYPGGIKVLTAADPTPYRAGNKGQIIIGRPGGDTINGGNGKDCIVGGSGNDVLGAGDEDPNSKDKENGKDILVGGPGDDRLISGNGKDRLYGGEGDDYCEGENGKDFFDSCKEIVDNSGKNSKLHPLTPEAFTLTPQTAVDSPTTEMPDDAATGDEDTQNDLTELGAGAPKPAVDSESAAPNAGEPPTQESEATEPSDVESSTPAEPTPSADPTDEASSSSTGEPETPAE